MYLARQCDTDTGGRHHHIDWRIIARLNNPRPWVPLRNDPQRPQYAHNESKIVFYIRKSR